MTFPKDPFPTTFSRSKSLIVIFSSCGVPELSDEMLENSDGVMLGVGTYCHLLRSVSS